MRDLSRNATVAIVAGLLLGNSDRVDVDLGSLCCLCEAVYPFLDPASFVTACPLPAIELERMISRGVLRRALCVGYDVAGAVAEVCAVERGAARCALRLRSQSIAPRSAAAVCHVVGAAMRDALQEKRYERFAALRRGYPIASEAFDLTPYGLRGMGRCDPADLLFAVRFDPRTLTSTLLCSISKRDGVFARCAMRADASWGVDRGPDRAGAAGLARALVAHTGRYVRAALSHADAESFRALMAYRAFDPDYAAAESPSRRYDRLPPVAVAIASAVVAEGWPAARGTAADCVLETDDFLDHAPYFGRHELHFLGLAADAACTDALYKFAIKCVRRCRWELARWTVNRVIGRERAGRRVSATTRKGVSLLLRAAARYVTDQCSSNNAAGDDAFAALEIMETLATHWHESGLLPGEREALRRLRRIKKPTTNNCIL